MRVWLLRSAVAALALAVGIGLGVGPLQHSGRERDRELAAVTEQLARAESRIETLTASGAYGADYAAATLDRVVAGRLSGRSVALVLLPGAATDDVDALRAVLDQAGARVTAEARLTDTATGSGSRQLVEALTSQMVAQAPTLEVPESAVGYERFGALLARALGADRGAGPRGSAYDQTAVGIVAGLEAADLVTVTRSARRASVTVVVAGAPASQAAAGTAVPVTILDAYAAATPTVLTGPAAAAGPRGVLGAVRANRDIAGRVPGVDSVDTPMGRAAVVLALAARIRGGVGQYGGVGATGGPVPAP